jgi:signal transduction histidine kinase/CheY-like chemotaxis protein
MKRGAVSCANWSFLGSIISVLMSLVCDVSRLSGDFDPALAPLRGQLRARFFPLIAEEPERRNYSITIGQDGRVFLANGSVYCFDGEWFSVLPIPGDSVYTGAVARDAKGRIWIANTSGLGWLEENTEGVWILHPVEGPGVLDGANEVHSLHLFGDTIVLVGESFVARRASARSVWEEWPLQADLRFPAHTDGASAVVVEHHAEATRILRIAATGEPEVLSPRGWGEQATFYASHPSGAFLIGDAYTDTGAVSATPDSILRSEENLWWRLNPMSAVSTPEGWVLGCSGGLLGIDFTGRMRFALTGRSPVLPSTYGPALAVGPRGWVWGVNAHGLFALDSSARVTAFRTAEGVLDPIGEVELVDDEIWLGGPRGVTILGPSRNPPSSGRLTPGEDMPGLESNSLHRLRDLAVSHGTVAAAARHFAIRPNDSNPWQLPLGKENVWAHTVAFAWDDHHVLGANREELFIFKHDERDVWSLRARHRLGPIERVVPAGPFAVFLLRPDGTGEIAQWFSEESLHESPQRFSVVSEQDAVGQIFGLEGSFGEGEMLRLWGEQGGLVIPLKPGTDTRSQPIRVEGLATATRVLATSGVQDDSAECWILAQVAPDPFGETSSAPRYMIFRGRWDSADLLVCLSGAPVEVVEEIGYVKRVVQTEEDEQRVWWLAASQGVARISLADLPDFPVKLPTPLVQQIKFDMPAPAIDEGEGTRLEGDRSVEVQVVLLSHLSQESLALQWRLGGLETAWSRPAFNRARRWERLPAGHYQVEVRAVSASSRTSEALVIPFTVLPRWYEKAFFPWLLLLLLLGLSITIAFVSTRRLRRREAELEKLISERTSALMATNAELSRQSSSREELIAMVTHELRSPLVGARLMAHSLADNHGFEESRSIALQLDQLQHLLDGNLDLSRFELGLMPTAWREVETTEYIASLIAPHQASARAKALGFELEVSPGTPTHLGVESLGTGRVFHNLLSNAVKYTEAGKISLRLRFERECAAHAHGWLCAEIADTGPGLPEKTAALFRADGRARTNRPGGQGGVGLGLPLTHREVTWLGGSINLARSGPGGTTIAVKLPVVALSGGENLGALISSVRILVVEDNTAHRDHLVDLLEPLGAFIEFAGSAAEASRRSVKVSFDLTFLDFNLPDATGLEWLRSARADGLHLGTVYFVSALDSPVIAKACLEAGAHGFVPKPISLATVLGIVAGVLR